MKTFFGVLGVLGLPSNEKAAPNRWLYSHSFTTMKSLLLHDTTRLFDDERPTCLNKYWKVELMIFLNECKQNNNPV